MPPDASPLVTYGIGGLALLMAGVFVLLQHESARRLGQEASSVALKAALGAAAWLGLSGGLAHIGVLSNFESRPPPFVGLFIGIVTLGTVLGLSRVGLRMAQGIPLWVLVIVQGFRLPLELVMHQAAVEGTMPNVMSYSGRNFDIVTGVLAIVVGLALRQGAPRWIAQVWNLVGFLLLVNIAGVALVSSPMIQAFGPNEVNSWVAYFPFVWLPAVLVCFALMGHIVVWRALKVVEGPGASG